MIRIPLYEVSEAGKAAEYVASFASRKPDETKTRMVPYASQAREASPEKVCARVAKAAALGDVAYTATPTPVVMQESAGLTLSIVGYITDAAGAAALPKVK